MKAIVKDLICDPNHSFFKYYCDREKVNRLSLESKHSFSGEIFIDLDRLNNLNPKNESIKKWKILMYDIASELYTDFLGIYYHK